MSTQPIGSWQVQRGKGRPPAYKLADGTRVPSVTTITGARKSGVEGLLVWANQLGQGEKSPEPACPKCGRKPGQDHREVRQQAADAGTLAHSMVENYIHDRDPLEGVTVEDDVTLQQATRGFESFKAWEQMMEIQYIATEIAMVSEGHHFGGTPDVLWRGKDKLLTLGDWKSGSAIYGDHLIQLAAYRHLCEEHFHETIVNCCILRFGKEHGDFHFHSYPIEVMQLGWHAFLHLLAMYDLDKRLKKVAS